MSITEIAQLILFFGLLAMDIKLKQEIAKNIRHHLFFYDVPVISYLLLTQLLGGTLAGAFWSVFGVVYFTLMLLHHP